MTHTTRTPADPARASDIAAIEALLGESRAAWNRGDGAAYGSCFTADATDVTFVGTVYQGGQEIGRPKRLGKLATYTVVREPEAGWRIAAVQKTRRKRLMEAVSFRLHPATRPATLLG